MLKQLITSFLISCAKRVLRRHKPIIIAITGSVGKTSTKRAIAAVLRSKFSVLEAPKNYNTEIGVPLTILREENQEKSLIGWKFVCVRSFFKSIFGLNNYPTHLVLEFGADRPGDIEQLVRIAPPTVSVVTRISSVHVENYPNREALVAEKSKIVQSLPSEGLAVLNADEEEVGAMANLTNGKVKTYGFGPDADLNGDNYKLNVRLDDRYELDEELASISFVVRDSITKETVSSEIKNILGIHQAYNALAACAVGQYFDISLKGSLTSLETSFVSASGRLRLLHGIKGSLILDDSYNAAPASMAAALDVLGDFKPVEDARRIAVLGHMAELGDLSDEEHRTIGWKVAELDVGLLIVVGSIAHEIAHGAIEAGMSEDLVHEFNSPEEAGRFLDHEVKKGDIVLVKGSQSARMEKVVKDIMAEPLRASELLVRQEKKWIDN